MSPSHDLEACMPTDETGNYPPPDSPEHVLEACEASGGENDEESDEDSDRERHNDFPPITSQQGFDAVVPIDADAASFHSASPQHASPRRISPTTLHSLKAHFGVREQVNEDTPIPSPTRTLRGSSSHDDLLTDWEAVLRRAEGSVDSLRPASARLDSKQDLEDNTAETEYEEFRQLYYPGEGPNGPWLTDMFLDDVMYQAVKLQKEYVIFGSSNELYKPLKNQDRRDQIHRDLCRFSEAVKNYKTYLGSPLSRVPNSEITPGHLFGRVSYIQNLAILECATQVGNPNEVSQLEDLGRRVSAFKSSPLVRSHIHAVLHPPPKPIQPRKKSDDVKGWWYKKPLFPFGVFRLPRRQIFERLLVATFSSIVILIPMYIMVFIPDTMLIVLVVTAFTLIVATILAVSMAESTKVDILTTSAGYASVLMVFAGEAIHNVKEAREAAAAAAASNITTSFLLEAYRKSN